MTQSGPSRDVLLRVSVGGIIALFLGRVWMTSVASFPGDRWALGRIYAGISQAAPERFLTDAVAALASPVPVVVTVVGALLVLRSRGVASEMHGMLVAASVVVANAGAKLIFGPATVASAVYHDGSAASYPSGHVSYVTAVFGYLAGLASERGAWRFAVCLTVPVVLMGPARVASGAHFPSDAFGGYALGASWLSVAWLVRESGMPVADRGSRR